MKRIAIPLAYVLALLGGSAFGAGRYEGFAYASGGETLLYRESHWLDGATRTVLYRCPDGKPFARKVVITGDQPAAPNFVSNDGRDGYREGVRREGAGQEVFVRASATAKMRSRPIKEPDNAVIDAGFDAYIVANWDKMAVGTKRDVEFLIPSRLGYTDFAIRRLPDAKVIGVPARRYQLKLGAWYGFALPQIDVAYTSAGRQLLQYKGLGNIRSNKGDNLSVRVEFPPARQVDGADNSISHPGQIALDGRCPL